MKKFFLFLLGAFLISTSLWAKELVPLSVSIEDDNMPLGNGYGKTSMSPPVRLILTYSNVIGDTKKVGLLSSLKEINLGGITDLNCKLSDFVQCTGLQTLVCSDSPGVSGTIEDLIPLSGNLTSLQLNGLCNVSGTLKSLLMLPLVTNCSLGYTGVSGKVTDLNGMKPNGGTLTLRVSDYMTNDFNSVAFVNNNTYTITFNNSGNVSNVS